jgi:hypothetical protein
VDKLTLDQDVYVEQDELFHLSEEAKSFPYDMQFISEQMQQAIQVREIHETLKEQYEEILSSKEERERPRYTAVNTNESSSNLSANSLTDTTMTMSFLSNPDSQTAQFNLNIREDVQNGALDSTQMLPLDRSTATSTFTSSSFSEETVDIAKHF